MLSIGPISSVGYYAKIQDDYYARGTECLGRWWDQGPYLWVFQARSNRKRWSGFFKDSLPDGSHALVRNAGSPKRRCGFDLTLSAPKSVSVAWSQADATTRTQLENVFDASVNETLCYIEDNASFVRQGKGGTLVKPAGLVVSVFRHHSNRNLEPHLHAHCLVANIGITEEKTNSLLAPILFEHKMDIGGIFRAELAARLEHDLGLTIERRNDVFFEIRGVPSELMNAFSSRRQAIQQALDERGFSGAKASAIATLTTRPQKQEVNQETLLSRWQAVGRSLGFSMPELSGLLQAAPLASDHQQARAELEAAVRTRLSRLSEFTKKDVVRAIAVEAPGRGFDRHSIQNLAQTFLASEEVQAISQSGKTHYAFRLRRTHGQSLEHSLLSLEPDDDLEIWDTL